MGKGKDGGLECCVVCGGMALCCVLVLVVLALIGLGIAKIVIGAIYLHDCSLQYLVPIYLIVSGVAPLLFSGTSRNNEDGTSSFKAGDGCAIIGFLFQLAWLICGSVWVYPTYGKVKSHDLVPCTVNVTEHCYHGNCNKDLITFAFAMVTVDWIVFVILIGAFGGMIYKLCTQN